MGILNSAIGFRTNKMMKKISFLISSLFVIVILSECKNTKLVQEQHPSFKLIEASFGKIVPGEKDNDVKVELSIFMDNKDDRFVCDSVLFKGNTMVPQTRTINGKLHLMVVVKDANITTNKYESLDIKSNHAILFYTDDAKTSYFYHLKEIKENEAIYLP